ncbi:MAG TPA: hypothetical protein VH877_12900 [Polyangia bacterium]|nr:hypothetical protein [Polyangia bacterium]
MDRFARRLAAFTTLAIAGCTPQGAPLTAAPTGHGSQAVTSYTDCLGGAYVNGKCQPLQLASNLNRPFALALDGTRVYWTVYDGGLVGDTSVLGGPVDAVASGAQAAGPSGIAVTGGYVLYATEVDNTIWRAAPGSASPTPVPLATGQARPISVTTDGVYVYWANLDGGTLRRVRIRRTPLDNVETLADGMNRPWGLALYGGYLYWTNSANEDPAWRGAIYRVPVAGGTPEKLSSAHQPYGIAVDASGIYWADYAEGTINRIGLDGQPGPTGPVLWPNQAGPISLLRDGSTLYWANYTGGQVRRAALGAAAPEDVATSQLRPIGLAQDGLALYWANDDWNTSGCAQPACGTIMKVAK